MTAIIQTFPKYFITTQQRLVPRFHRAATAFKRSARRSSAVAAADGGLGRVLVLLVEIADLVEHGP